MQHFLLETFPLPEKTWSDSLEAHQLTYEFYSEVSYRQDFDAYCQWYYDTAAQHRAEADSMKHDLNIFGWFCGQ
ncbi:MAG: hypothetical protein VKL39_03020 [Leptolyngbyaceae bacterium]|nr:hypothetical protein [Leptolyngbyaceae bacterium]